MRINPWATVALLLASSTTFALPPNAAPDLRPGANHHTGDDGFEADLGRAPTAGEEKLRMHEHFVAVRARLAALPATKPELAGKRKELLAALDAYIAAGITPDNNALPWRTPVFIDQKGTICAVGFLIQESAGRPLAEKIAAGHRYSFIEDIAKDMPEVQAWVAQSGFTLDELGQIQPGYQGPDVLLFGPLQLSKKDADDGRYVPEGAYDVDGMTGFIQNRKMEGAWALHDGDGSVLGAGTFHHGAGPWISLYPSGVKLAEGTFAHNAPSGHWRFFHESGNLAAEGSFTRGQRTGDWKFFYDEAKRTPIAAGGFDSTGRVDGTWKHFDERGVLLATSQRDEVPASWTVEKPLFWNAAYRVDVENTAGGITHRIHQGTMSGDTHRLDELATKDGSERIFYRGDNQRVFDTRGHELVKVDGAWRSDDCHWSKSRRSAAVDGDLANLHGLIWNDADEKCAQGAIIAPARAAKISALVAAMTEVRGVTPQEIEKLALGDEKPTSLTDDIAASMSLDIEWPHVDHKFIEVYGTLPGYRSRS